MKMTIINNNQPTAGRRILRNISTAKRNRIELNMTISARLDDLLRRHELTVEGFAIKVGVSAEIVNKWLSGMYVFSTDELSDIATTLQCSPKDLMSLTTPIIELSWVVRDVITKGVETFSRSHESNAVAEHSNQIKTYSTKGIISGYQPN